MASTHSKHQVEQVYRTATPDYTTRRLVTSRHSIVITTPLQKTSECHYGDKFTFAQPELRGEMSCLSTSANDSQHTGNSSSQSTSQSWHCILETRFYGEHKTISNCVFRPIRWSTSGGFFSLSSGPIHVHVHCTLCSECTIKLDAVTKPCVFF